MAEYVVAQAAVLIVPTLGKGPNGFRAQLRRDLAAVNEELKINVKLNNLAKSVAQVEGAKRALAKDPIILKVDTRQITEIRHEYENLAREMKKGLTLDFKILGLSLLPQLVQGLAAANASMVQLAQSATVLPGVIAGAASSFATLMTGLGGVKDAFKEYGDAQKNAAQEGLKARNAALNVQNAYRDLGRSIKDAKRNLEDLNAQLRDAPLDEAEAIIRVQEAQAEAADRASKSGLQQQKDLISLRKAENDLADVRLRNSRLVQDVADANAKGVAGADNVREASERLAKAQDDASTKATKLSDSLKELSPNAQAFVQAVTGMQSQWSAFRNTVQDRLFAGLDQDVTKLAQTSLPLLERGFGGIADALNSNVKSAMAVLQTPTNQGFMEKIFGNTADAQGRLSKAFDPMVDSLLRLSAVGSAYLPRLADALDDVLTRFDNFIVRAESDGSLDKWVDNGLEAMTQLGNSLLNVGSILNSVAEAFTGSGGTGLLGALESGTAKLAEFLKSAEGQERLTAFFEAARQELENWQPLLSSLPGVMANIAQAGQQWANMLLPFLRSASTLLADHPALAQAVFAAYLAWNGIVPILKGMKSGLEMVNGTVDLFKRQVDESGNKIAGSSGFKGKVDALTGAIMSPGGLVAGVTLAATWVGTNLAQAHDEAAAAAQRQKTDLDNLARSLSDVTGAATAATNALIAKNFRVGLNEGTGQTYGNLLSQMIPDVNKQNELIEKVKSGDLQGALGMVPGADARSIEGTDWWSSYGENLKSKGLTSDIVAKAVNGEPAAKAKFEAWINEERKRKAPPGISDPEVLAGLEKAKLITQTPDLADFQEQLPNDVKMGSRVQGEIYSNLNNLQQAQADKRYDSQVGYGRVRLPSGSPLAALGVVGEPGLGANGGELITKSQPQGAFADQLRNDGVTFRADGADRFIVSLTPEAANKYLERYASGGLISGPGNGTSDSILARLSHGEFVVNASATQRHLPLLEQINGGGMPAFAPGGQVTPWWMPASPAPSPPPLPPSLLDPDWQKKIPINSSGAVPAAGNRPGDFNRSSFKTYGQGQLERRGVDPAKKAAEYENKTSPVVSAIGNSIKAGLGLSAPGYGETVAAKGNFTWYGPAANSPAPKPKPNITDPNAPKNLNDFYTQLLGVPVARNNVSLPFPGKGISPGPVPSSSGASVAPSAPSAAGGAPKWVPGKGWVDSSGRNVPGPGASAAERSIFYSGSATHSGSGAAPGPVVSGSPMPSAVLIPTMTGPLAGPIPPTSASGVTAEVNFGAQEAAKYGLSITSGLRPNETKSYHSTGQAGDYSNQKSYGPPTPEMTAFANEVLSKYVPYIDELIYSGVSQNIYKGQLVPAIDMEGSPYNTGQASYHGDHVHIAWKPGALQAMQQAGMMPGSLPSILQAASPSNVPMALTPTGLALPQLSYTAGAGAGAGAAGAAGKLPTPEEMAANYAKYVSDAWQETIGDLVKNAGQIALQFVGGFFGLDFGPILSSVNSVLSDAGGGLDALMGEGDGEGGEDNLPANADVDTIMQTLGGLPPEYQNLYAQAVQQNPSQAFPLLQQIAAMATQGAGLGSAQYDPAGGAEQWRPTVRKILQQQGAKYGITNVQAWEDAIIRQIQTESNGNPNINNLNDSNGRGGTQAVYGLGQFLPETFAKHNVTGGDIRDPIAQIYAMIDYVSSRYGMDASGAPLHIGRGVGYASGGRIKGRGTGRSDSIIARVSNGEYIVRADAAQKHLGLLNAINSNKLPGFADGGVVNPLWPVPPPPPVTPPPPPVAPPPVAPPAPAPPAPGGVDGQPVPPVEPPPADPAADAMAKVGEALGGVGAGISGAAGAEAPEGATPEGDPRAVLGAAPTNLDHNKAAVSMGIQAAGSAISGAINTAIQAGTMAAAGAGGAGVAAGPAAGAASSLISGLVSAGSGAVSGAVNILSSLMVGTLSGGGNSTAGAYGAPLTPQAQGKQPFSGGVVNNWGGVTTSNPDEFYRIQQRRELQNASPMLPRR